MSFTTVVSAGVVVLIGAAAVQAQDRGGGQSLPGDPRREAEARAAEAEEKHRLVVARLMLYEKSELLIEGFDSRSELLEELFARARQIVEDVHGEPQGRDGVEGVVVDLLLRGRDGTDPGVGEDEPRAGSIEMLPAEFSGPGRLHLRFRDASLEPFVSTLSKLMGREFQFRIPSELADVKVSVRAEGSSIRDVLELVTEDAGITYAVRDGIVVFVSPDKRPESLAQIHRFAWEVITALGILGRAEAADLLERMVSLEDRQIAARAEAALRQIRR